MSEQKRKKNWQARSNPAPIDERFNRAVGYHQNGDFTQAERAYREVLASAPNHVTTLHLVGVVMLQTGRLLSGVELIDRALAIKPDYPDALKNRGNALRILERPADALVSFDKALAIKPEFAEAWSNRGNALQELGRLEEAVESYDRALAITPDYVEALSDRGAALLELKRFDEALACCDKALAFKPDYAQALNNRAAALTNLKRLGEALRSYDRALAIRPDFADALNGRGNTLRELARGEDALASYDRAVAIKPDYAEAFNNRGATLGDLGRWEEALASFDKALAIKLDYAEAFSNRGAALRDLGRLEEALASYDKALAIQPDYAEAHNSRGAALQDLGRLEEALESFDQARVLKPDYADCIFNRGMLALAMGDFATGWSDYEKRWDCSKPLSRKLKVSFPTWRNERIFDKKIIVYEEQGFGDVIQFCRYLKYIVELEAQVTFFVRPSLVKLMKTVDKDIRVLADYPANERFDYQCALLSLPIAFKTRLENISADTPYLSAEPERVYKWRHRLGEEGFKVGIAWQGSKLGSSLRKSFALAEFVGLSRLPKVRLISLQMNDGVEQLSDLPEGMKVETLGDDFDAGGDAFLDTAAVMENLDLVISADTSIAHLAGALGRPVWVALKWVADWRWLLDRSDSPWYPTMRLFRQRTRDDWREPFSHIESALRGLVQEHAK